MEATRARRRVALAKSERLEREESEVRRERRLLDARAAGHEPDFLELDDWGVDKLGQNEEYLEDKFGHVSFRQQDGSLRQKTNNDSGRLTRLSLGHKSLTFGAESDHGQGAQRSQFSEPHLGASWGSSPPSSSSQAPIRGAASKGQQEGDEEGQITPRASTESGHAAGTHASARSRPQSNMHSRGSTKSSPTVKEVLGWLQNRFTRPGRSGAPYSSPDSRKSPVSDSRKSAEVAEVKPAKPPALRLHDSSGSAPQTAAAHRGSSSPAGAVFGSPVSSPRALQATPRERSAPLPPTVHHLRLRASTSAAFCDQSGPAGGPSAPSSPVSHASSPGVRKSRGQVGAGSASLDSGDSAHRAGRLGQAHASVDSGDSFTGKGPASTHRSGRLGQVHTSMDIGDSFTGKRPASTHRSGRLSQVHANMDSWDSTSQGLASTHHSGRLSQVHASMDSGDSFTGKGPVAHRTGRLNRSLDMPSPTPAPQPHLRKQRLSVMSDRGMGSANFAEALSDCLL